MSSTQLTIIESEPVCAALIAPFPAQLDGVFADPQIAYAAESILLVLLFAAMGAIRAYLGKASNSEEWDWEKARWPIGFGAAAGVLAFAFGVDIGSMAFYAILGSLLFYADQFRSMLTAGTERYTESIDAGDPITEAIVESLIHAVQEGDSSALMARLQQLEAHGAPANTGELKENVDAQRQRTREGFQREGLHGAANEAWDGYYEAVWPDDPEDEFPDSAPRPREGPPPAEELEEREESYETTVLGEAASEMDDEPEPEQNSGEFDPSDDGSARRG